MMWRELFDRYRHYGEIINDREYIKDNCFYRELTISHNGMTRIFKLRNGDLVEIIS